MFSRFKADKKRYLRTLDHLESAATQAGSIVGSVNSLHQDLDRCRATEVFRRKAGELLHEAHGKSDREDFRRRLKAIDSLWSEVEDAVTDDPPDPQRTKKRVETAVTAYQSLKASLKERSRYRISLVLLGRLPPDGE
jgi:hypothetical protein